MGKSLSYLSITGLLGYGYPTGNLEIALEKQPELAFIGVDAGSTDPGPYYLGSGSSFVKEDRVQRDLGFALEFAVLHHIPLVIGTAGGSGAKPHVDAFVEIVKGIASDRNLSFNMAVIYTDVDHELIRSAQQAGKLSPCGNAPDLDPDLIDTIRNPVAQVGTEPIIHALEGGADVIVCGRCCDTAIFAALPMMKGFDPAYSLHSAKIAECGTLCAEPGSASDSLLCVIDEDSFFVEPVNTKRTCTAATVAAHSLYEQPDPRWFVEPEGIVDLAGSVYEGEGERGVRVTGTRFIPSEEPTLKLEGSTLAGYRSVAIAGVCDPIFIAHLAEVEQKVRQSVTEAFPENEESCAGSRFNLRTYGAQALANCHARNEQTDDMAGIVLEVIGPDQETADSMLSFARSTMLHQSFPGRKTTAGNLAYPYSPSDISCGPVYEFSLYHLLHCTDIVPCFPAERYEVSRGRIRRRQ